MNSQPVRLQAIVMPETNRSEEGEGDEETLLSLPKTIPENSVEYWLFLLNHDEKENDADLEALHQAADDLSQSLTEDYIWQRDHFQLELKEEDGTRCLYGITDYGDAIEDEWLIVYILRRMTEAQANLWVRVADTDGEFLLIEAANVVPDWLSPGMDQNRAWIHDGKLLIIPCESNGSNGSRPQTISLPKAVEFIRLRSAEILHSPFIQEEAFFRLGKYPTHISDSAHCSLVTIPRKLAYILHVLPKSLAPAVEYFYLRDPLSLQPIMSTSASLAFPTNDLVTLSVRFSRVLFAQLKSQHFDPPPMWQRVLRNAVLTAAPDDRERIARLETGMKLTTGFEILIATAGEDRRKVVQQVEALMKELPEGDNEMLPTDEEMKSWRDFNRNDGEAWMDINYEDFERELDGKPRRHTGGDRAGFGDAGTETDLRKIVSRFEAFLNDERAGLDGADMDNSKDDDDEETEDEDSEFEDKVVGFDEEAFSSIMRNMLGLPTANSSSADAEGPNSTLTRRGEKDAATQEDGEIQELSIQMENELRNHGALKYDDANAKQLAVDNGSRSVGKGKELERRCSTTGTVEDEEGDDSEVQIDYILARNLLESFKSQAGLAGPTGNVLGMMGFRLPRDDDDEGGEDD
ncbi:hypothetical protein L249_7471 [Ophiocordyceps polyrhachis-furcata BCC 54312]|uniref:Uncharacterized protein n=1 Tax=Ophiocordyceps polyrhachis-furcata BCC 54312 TaxID=1330021 RepID=A0A367LAK3_9HYPO|nr:hypothetical protein L249_7471 [Ophiocordyceps polyrhachis-furcata BCC 54312]